MTKRNAMQEWENKVKAAKEAHDEAAANLKQAHEASEPVRRERGFNLVESQQIRTQIDICRARIEELHLLIRAKEREAEEIEERTRTETQVYKQKVKHLMHVHRKDLATLDADKKQTKEKQQQEHQGATKLQEIDDEHAHNMEALFEDYELQRINETHEIQERKDHHIRRLMKSHDKAFNEMRDFYNKITRDHLAFITQYEQELEDMDRRYKEFEQRKKTYEREISELNRKLADARTQNNQLHKILATHESDKMALANSRARIQMLT